MRSRGCDHCIAVNRRSKEEEVTVWDIENARKLHDIKFGRGTKAVFCNNDTWIACKEDNKILCVDHLTGYYCFATFDVT